MKSFLRELPHPSNPQSVQGSWKCHCSIQVITYRVIVDKRQVPGPGSSVQPASSHHPFVSHYHRRKSSQPVATKIKNTNNKGMYCQNMIKLPRECSSTFRATIYAQTGASLLSIVQNVKRRCEGLEKLLTSLTTKRPFLSGYTKAKDNFASLLLASGATSLT